MVVLSVFAGCGPAGTLKGKVNVEGGSAGGIAVIAYGPSSSAAVTKDDGSFQFERLPDGAYVVRATLRGAEEEELSTTATITQGMSSEAVLNFKLATSKITGRVAFSDGSNPQGLTVNVVGPVSAGARTEANGSFSFDNLKSGAYLVSVEAPDTKEGRVAVGVFASGAVDAGELKLTPVGRVAGAVSYNSMPASGVAVTVPGTDLAAVTDDMGRFVLNGVPAGAQTVFAKTGVAPFFRSASAMVLVARGANPDVMLTLTDDMPPTGQVTGVITFHGQRSPRDITVSAPGSGVSTTPLVNGSYTLTLPEGVWDIVANAPSHPQLTLGRVQVSAMRVITLPGRELSWWRPMWTSSTPLTGGVSFVSSTAADATHSWAVLSLNDPVQRRLALVNSTTFEFRIIAVGSTSSVRISRNAKYVGWSVAGTAFVYEIATGVIQTFNAQQAVTDLQFSSDETALFLTRSGPTLTRITFSMVNAPRAFPPGGGNANAIYMQSPDRWFVQEGTDLRLVEVANDTPAIFANVNQFSVSPTAWALTNCAASCELRVLGPSATQNVRDSVANPPPGSISVFNSATLQSRGDYPCFTQGGVQSYCVRASDGTHTPLIGVPSQFKLNEAGTRVIFVYTAGTNIVREEAFPPQMSTTNLDSSANVWSVGWLSPTRAYALERSGANRKLHLIAAGTDTLDTDVGTQGIFEGPPLLIVPQTSTSRWRAILGNNPPRLIDVPTNIPIYSVGVRALATGTTAVTRWAGVSFDPTLTYVVEDMMTNVRVVQGGAVSGANRSGAVEFAGFTRSGGGSQAFLFYNNNAIIEAQDDVSLETGFAQPNNLAAAGLSADLLTIFGGVFSL